MNQDQRNAFNQNQQAGGQGGYPSQNPGYSYPYSGVSGAEMPMNYAAQGYTGQGMPVQGYVPQGGGAQGNVAGYSAQGNAAGYSAQGYTGQMNGGAGYGAAFGASGVNGAFGSQGSAAAFGAQGYTGQTGMGQGYAAQSYPGQTGMNPGYGAQGYAALTNPAQGYAAPAGTSQGYAAPVNPAQGYTGQAGMAQGNPAGYSAQANPAQSYNAQGYPIYQGQAYGGTGYTGQQPRMPYPQMKAQPATPPAASGQMPLNGGGYVPQRVPVRRKPFTMNDTLLIAICAVLLVLFAVGLFVPGLSVLKWIFLALAAGMVAFLWIRPVTAKNKRLCVTIVMGALALVTLVSALGLGSGSNGTADRQNGVSGNASSSGTGSQGNGTAAAAATAAPTATPPASTPEPSDDSAVTDRLYLFFQYWSVNQTDEMLTLCSPSWQSKTDNPKSDLFSILANRTPKDYNFENITGTNDDQSRTVTLNTLIDRNNGKDPSRYRLNVIMVKESDVWYVDPQSLKTYEVADTPDPNVTATPAPTEEVHADASTILYYNPDGGTKYHLDQNCKSTHQKYLPFKGHFTYGEINNPEYVKLSPCNVCGAPLRP